jgi:phage shock protein C
MNRRYRDDRDPYGDRSHFESPNPSRLYRSSDDSMVFGVCGGVAERFGWDASVLRVLTLVGFFFSGGGVLIGYLIAALVIPKRPSGFTGQRASEEDTEFWREVSDRPRATFRSVRYKFMDLEERLRNLETSVTSDEWRLRREFRDLEKK